MTFISKYLSVMPKPQGKKGIIKISSFFNKVPESVNTHEQEETQILSSNHNNIDYQMVSPKSKRKRLHSSSDTEDNVNSKKNITQSSSKENIEVENNVKQFISIKTPEKLLTPEALKLLNTSKINQSSSSVRRTFFSTTTPSKASSNAPLKETKRFLKSPKNGSPTKKEKGNKEQKTPTKSKSPKKVDSVKKESNDQETPTKKIKTPKKLFNKSPHNLNNFNVQILSNFVKVTPSKSMHVNKDEKDVEIVSSSEKKQSSILKYLSPQQSGSSAKAQQLNEATPTRPGNSQGISEEHTAKVRSKLDFSSCVEKSPKMKITNKSPIVSNETNIDNDLNDSWDEMPIFNYNLNFATSQHCKILEINKLRDKTVLIVKSTENEEHGICNLTGFWTQTNLNVGDTVHLSAEKKKEEWIISNDCGLLVFEPDLLVSTTSVVGSVFCKRKSVLKEKIRGFEPGNKVMLIGTLVHSLLQTVLQKKQYNQSQIESIVKDLLKSNDTTYSLYEIGLTLDEIENELMNFVPRIIEFIKCYVQIDKKQLTGSKDKNNWKGVIKSIEDIEDNVWCPQLGIKGKIDLTIKSGSHLMPLELKTGRATVSLEHRGQVIMYIMMMNKLGIKVPSGLLLYLREGVLKEIPISDREKRDIMMLRNELTYYLTRQPRIDAEANMLMPAELPEPINHQACERCEFNFVCASHLRFTKQNVEKRKYLKKIVEQSMVHVNDDHLKYFMHWNSLLALESMAQKDRKDVRTIYTLPAKEREAIGGCITNLKISEVIEESNGVYEHVFKKDTKELSTNLLSCGISKSNYVVISTETRPAVSAGFVKDLDIESIKVSLDRNLSKFSTKTFHVDTYDSNSIQTFNLASLSLLLDETEAAAKLRKIIIDKMCPTFEPKLPKIVATKGAAILKRLNVVQQRAVLKALVAKDYFLIKGMPGTGKTETIVALIQLLVALGNTVLVTSHTHSAVDNVCLKLIKYNVNFLRLGSESRLNEALLPYSERVLTKTCKTPEELEIAYNTPNIIAVTCLGSGHSVLSKRTLDVCIVDESTQVLQCSVIRPLFTAKKFVLLGDPDQLPAVVKSREAVSMGMSESLFERLQSPEALIALNLNYRMNKVITDLANKITYNGELLVANDIVANSTLEIPQPEFLKEKWISSALQSELEHSVCFIDTGPVWKLDHTVPWTLEQSKWGSKKSENNYSINIYEAAIVYKLVNSLLEAGVSPENIGVIASYRGQVEQISSIIKNALVDVSTVDQFQGKDKNVIIYSSTKSSDMSASNAENNKNSILEDKRRLTVALTRAKNKLILVGDVSTLCSFSTFSKLIPFLEKNTINLNEEQYEFNWMNVLNIDAV